MDRGAADGRGRATGGESPVGPDGRSAASLAALFAAVAADLEGVERRGGTGEAEYLRAGRPFAAVAGRVGSFLLRPDVGRAALRTPDSEPSARGPGWVAFAPADLDPYATDRAAAWFRSAWRLAGE